MDDITMEAIGQLSAAVTGLLPPPTVPSLPHIVRVIPSRVAPTGVGGFVGMHDSPSGEVVGRTVTARVVVTVQVRDQVDLATAVDAATAAVAARDEGQARSEGLLRIGLEEVAPAESTGHGSNQVHHLDLEFLALFEHLHVPTETAGTIEHVPVLFDVGSTRHAGLPLYRARFRSDPLGAFEVVDDPSATQGAPSLWEYDELESAIHQRSEIRGGSSAVDPEKPGTYLVLRPEAQPHPIADLILSTELRSQDRDGIGLVFRWQDPDNFYFLLLDERRNFRMLGRKVGGSFGPLDEPALDTSSSYTPGQVHSVRVSAQGDRIRAHIDGQLALEGRDSELPGAGRGGFICWGNGSARFFGIDLVAL